MNSLTSFCIIGIAGYSGSGKTTLIERLLPELKREGLAVGVMKHIHHALALDLKGKDTDRFFRAGADFVYAHDELQGFARQPWRGGSPDEVVGGFPRGLDLLIIEGHKDYAAPGIWLAKDRRSGARIPGRRVVFRSDPDYIDIALSHILEEIGLFHARRPLMAGLLIGGKSRRMGRPKALLKMEGGTLVERSFDTLSSLSEVAVLLGSGQIPKSLGEAGRLADVPDVKGPLAGMLSAFRWSPGSAWIISSVDMPLMNEEAWRWLLAQRRPGVWGVMPRIGRSRGVETAGAVYEPMLFEHVEALAGKGIVKLQEIAAHPKVVAPLIPEPLSHAWTNVNTPGEWRKAVERAGKS